MKLYRRENFLQKIRGFYHDTELIKVITGVRRCGKSCLMETVLDELLKAGIPKNRLIYLNLDQRTYRSIQTADQLENLIIQMSPQTDETKYLFIDEVQNVKNFETVINGFRTDGDYSIFITGSNSYLLSGELITKLTGRYLEFELYPLSFEEYLEMKEFIGKTVQPDLTSEFDLYISEGGFPKALQYEGEDKRNYIRGVIQEIFEKDIRRRVKIRKVSVFETVQRYIINNFGAALNLSHILSDLKKNGCSIKRETLYRNIKILEDAKIIYSAEEEGQGSARL